MRSMRLVITSLIVGCSLSSVGQTMNKTNVKTNTEVNPIIPYNLCADPTAVEYNGRLYVYGTNDQQELNTTGDRTKNTYGKITQLVCMSSADLVNWTWHGVIDVKNASSWIATSWAPSIVCREEEDGKTHFYLYYTNSASGIGVLTATSPTGPWKDPLGKALISGSTPGRGEQSNIIDPGVCIDDNGQGWLTFGGGDPNKKGSTLIPGNARIVKLGKDMISLDGEMKEIPAPFHFEANELNYINGKYVFSYSGGWNCNQTDWSNYDGRGNYSCPGNCSILAMVTDDPINGTWSYMGEILKNPGTFGYPWGNNHSHLQKFGNNYYMTYHTQYLESKLDLSGGYRCISINKASVSASSITASMNNTGPDMITANSPLANERIQAETMSNCAGIEMARKSNRQRDIVVTGFDPGDWTAIRGLTFPEDARSVTLRAQGKGVLKFYANRVSGTPIAECPLDNASLTEVTFDLTNVQSEGKTINVTYLYCTEADSSSPIEVDYFQFNSKSVEEMTAVEEVETSTPCNNTHTYNLAGQRVNENAKGVVIKNGKKLITK